MIQKIKTLILSASMLFVFAAPVVLPSSVAAVNIRNNVCSGASNLEIAGGENNAAADCAVANQDSKVNNIIKTILNIFSVIVGIVAVVMIVVAGFKYITSGGKDESVKGAKNTILYAIIGLVVVALAQIVVQFVLSKTPS